jgi:Rieske [2Fe-2S] domain
MATRAAFLTQPYGAYYHRDVPKEDEELTHVGPGTPCGEYLRRFWQPVALSKELQELPRRVRILGEDLVVFRDKSGQVGCLELHCPHRGTSLEFGLISEKGIRCCYHGSLMDVDWMESPSGMICIATRRVDENTWAKLKAMAEGAQLASKWLWS